VKNVAWVYVEPRPVVTECNIGVGERIAKMVLLSVLAVKLMF